MSNNTVRTRFAPSPTGPMHIGGVRQALFGWMYARRHNGQFILRIEDTDRERYIEGSVEGILRAFDWLGISFDEGPHVGGEYGPYVQSERLETYQKWANWLLEQGKAYKAFETPEELKRISDERKKMGLPPGYDGRARNLSEDEVARLEAEGKPYVLRFKMPREGKTVTQDMVRGTVEFDNENLQDVVLLKADGYPTYYLAHVVDDHLMQISHVTRGAEWLPSLPVHWNLWEAFGWEKPHYAHLPLILNPSGKGKLSKRKASSESGEPIPVLADDFIQGGYLPEAVVNFLTNIGWNFGNNEEVFRVQDAIQRFDLTDVNDANSAYPISKLEWLNGVYMRELSPQDLAKRLRPYLEEAGLTVDDELLLKVAPLVQTRMKLLTEIVDLAGFFFRDYSEFTAPDPDLIIQKKMDAAGTASMMDTAVAVLEEMDDWSHEALYERMKALAKELGVKNGQLFGSLRVAVTGQRVSPPTFESMEILGKEESLRRIRMALEAVKQPD